MAQKFTSEHDEGYNDARACERVVLSWLDYLGRTPRESEHSVLTWSDFLNPVLTWSDFLNCIAYRLELTAFGSSYLMHPDSLMYRVVAAAGRRLQFNSKHSHRFPFKFFIGARAILILGHLKIVWSPVSHLLRRKDEADCILTLVILQRRGILDIPYDTLEIVINLFAAANSRVVCKSCEGRAADYTCKECVGYISEPIKYEDLIRLK